MAVLSPRLLVRTLQRALPEARSGVTVLAYHLVGAGTSSPVDLPESVFRAQLAVLARSRQVVGLDEACVEGSVRQVVLTFDDAYANFYEVVWPILRELGFPALLYVPVDYIEGGRPPIRDTTLPACTWDQLREMVAEGLSIGSHTCSHPDLGKAPRHTLEHEIVTSRQVLEEQLGCTVNSFCYPRCLLDDDAAALIAQTYRTATIGGGQRWTPSTDLHRIPRISIRNDIDLPTFDRLLGERVWLEEFLADRVRQIRR